MPTATDRLPPPVRRPNLKVGAALVLALVALGVFIALVSHRRPAPPAPPSIAATVAPNRIAPPAPPATLAAHPAAPHNARVHQLLSELSAKYRFGPGRQKALRDVLPYLSPAELRAALDETFGNEACNDMTHVLLERLATVDAAAAFAFAHEHAFGVSPPWWLSVVGGLRQPQTALPELTRLPSGDDRTSFISFAVGRWAAADRGAAIEYALHGAPPEAQPLALANAIMFAAHDDHAAAFDLALKYADRINDGDFVQHLATDWASRDFDAALERVRTLQDSDTQQRALRGVTGIAITRDPVSARTLVAQIDDSAARTELYRQAALVWLNRDRDAALAWVASTEVLSESDKRYVRDADRSNRGAAAVP